ncbi:MAG: AIR synthase related protein [Promethearchaeota archaeon]
MSRLDDIIRLLLDFEGISRKFVLPSIIGKLRLESFHGNQAHGLGEDSAAIGTQSDEVILLTTDAIVEELCLMSPQAAGFNAVLANVMDIYAAGGTPTSFAAALSYSDKNIGSQLLQGLIDGSHTFQVPIVRGHTNPLAPSTYVVGSATGTVQRKSLLTAGGAKTGDALVLLFDQVGKRGSSYRLGWDSVTGRTSEEVVKRLSVMNDLANLQLLTAAKDISVAGMIGTAGMLLEYSGKGGIISLDKIDECRPDAIGLEDWLRMFISLGFLVTTPKKDLQEVGQVAKEHGVISREIGSVDESETLRLFLGSDENVIFDYSSGPIFTPRGTIEQ